MTQNILALFILRHDDTTHQSNEFPLFKQLLEAYCAPLQWGSFLCLFVCLLGGLRKKKRCMCLRWAKSEHRHHAVAPRSDGSSANLIVHLIFFPCAHMRSTIAVCFGGYTFDSSLSGGTREGGQAQSRVFVTLFGWMEKVMGTCWGHMFQSVLISSNRPIGEARILLLYTFF